MSSVKKEPPRFHIGDWVKFDYGPKKVSAMIVEDRGLLGIQGRRLIASNLIKSWGRHQRSRCRKTSWRPNCRQSDYHMTLRISDRIIRTFGTQAQEKSVS